MQVLAEEKAALAHQSQIPSSSQGLAVGATSFVEAARPAAGKLVDAKAKPRHDDWVWKSVRAVLSRLAAQPS
jgi:hypothetical protein